MKRILILFLLANSLFAASQTLPGYFTPISTSYEWNWGRFKNGLRLPLDTLPSAEIGSLAHKGGVVYAKLGASWTALGGSGGGADSSLFATRFHAANTYQPIGNYLTSSSLTNYYTKANIGSFFSGASPIGGYNKTNWDAAYSWGNHNGIYPTTSRFLDSIYAVRASFTTGAGDMTKAIYDINEDGIADDAEKVGGQLPSYYATAAALALKANSSNTVTVNGNTQTLGANPNFTVATSGTLNDLTDVAIATALNNQLLKYNSALSQWENWTPNFQTTISTTPGTYNSVTVNSGGQVTAGSNIAYLTSETDPVWNAQKGSYLTSAAASTTYQPIGSYELLSNKATSFTTINNTLYPTTQAVSDFVSSRVSASGVVYVTGNYAVQAGDRYLYLDQVAPTITLPSASSNNGRIITISTADGVATISPSFVYNQNGSAGTVQNAFSTGDYVSDGANWKKVTTSFGVWQQETGQTGVSLITGGYGYGPQNGSYTPSVLRKLVAGSNVSITENAGQVTISSTGAETDPNAILKTGTTNLTGNVIVSGGANTFQLTGTSEVFNVNTTTAGNAAQVQNNGTGNGLFAITNGGLGLIAQSTTATTNTVDEILRVNRISSGTAANGIGAKAAFNIETSTGSTTLAGSLGYKWADVTHASRTSQIDLEGVNNATPENYANFQTGGIVRVNNLADTLATKAYARSVGGAGGGSGETNTASNLGGGLANWDSKSGVDLRFNTFNATDFDLATNLLSIDATLKSTWNAKQNAISLTTIGTSGAATFDGTTLNIPQYSGGSGGHTIQDEGTPLTARANLNFIGSGVTVTDNAGTGATDVTISGGGGGGGLTVTNEGNDRILTSTGVGTATAESGFTYDATNTLLNVTGEINATIRYRLNQANGFTQLFGDGNAFAGGHGTAGMGFRNDGGVIMFASGGSTPQLTVSNTGDAVSVAGTSFLSNELKINTTDQGDYKLQVAGNIWTSGLIKATAYGDGTNTGTATYGAAFDVDGNLIEVALGGGGGGSMVYPAAGIALSTGTAWGTSITDNSANWNTAFTWGNHATAGYNTASNTTTLSNKTIPAATNSVEGILLGVRVLSTGTSYTPTAGTTKIDIEVIGAGGGGGGASGAASSVGAAAGGGSGAILRKYQIAVTNTAYTIAIGAAGTAGANTGATGGNGGNTTITIGATTYTANGGVGGAGQVTGTALAVTLGGAAGASTNGDVNGAGQNGDNGVRLSGTVGISGAGGTSSFGAGGAALATAGAGNAATGYGAGGGGALSTANTARLGGVGSQGVIIIREYK